MFRINYLPLLVLIPALACGTNVDEAMSESSDATSSSSDDSATTTTGSEAGSEMGESGDGDGDGDGSVTTNPATSGDGDGDSNSETDASATGDGDGDLCTVLDDDQSCAVCMKEECCDAYTQCENNDGCACMLECIRFLPSSEVGACQDQCQNVDWDAVEGMNQCMLVGGSPCQGVCPGP